MLFRSERKNKLWKADCENRERDVAQREQQLAAREAELARKAEALDLQKLELEREVERCLKEIERNHQEVLDEKVKYIKDLQLKETEAQKTIADTRKKLLAEQESARACGSKPSWTARRWPGWRSP